MVLMGRAFMAGALGALVLSVGMALVRLAGTPLRLELLLGSFFTRDIDLGAWMLGFVLMVCFGGFIAIGYAVVFEKVLGRAGWPAGLLVGVVHVAGAGVALGFASTVHPFAPESVLPAPEYFATALGLTGTVSFVGLHLLYGAVVGAAYQQAARERGESPGLGAGPLTARAAAAPGRDR